MAQLRDANVNPSLNKQDIRSLIWEWTDGLQKKLEADLNAEQKTTLDASSKPFHILDLEVWLTYS